MAAIGLPEASALGSNYFSKFMFEIQFNNFKRSLSELILNEMRLKQIKTVLVKCMSVLFVVHQVIG